MPKRKTYHNLFDKDGARIAQYINEDHTLVQNFRLSEDDAQQLAAHTDILLGAWATQQVWNATTKEWLCLRFYTRNYIKHTKETMRKG